MQSTRSEGNQSPHWVSHQATHAEPFADEPAGWKKVVSVFVRARFFRSFRHP
jgi:hypothetical protein